MRTLTYEQLDQVRADIHAYMPKYNVKRVDPFAALADRKGEGVTNCFGKAAVACGLLVARYNIEPFVAYSDRLHGTDRPTLRSATGSKNMAHITTLVGESSQNVSSRILSLCFGIEGKSGVKVFNDDEGDILDYNESMRLADLRASGQDIAPTAEAKELGIYIGEWREGCNRYLRAIERPEIDPDALISRVAEVFESPKS